LSKSTVSSIHDPASVKIIAALTGAKKREAETYGFGFSRKITGLNKSDLTTFI